MNTVVVKEMYSLTSADFSISNVQCYLRTGLPNSANFRDSSAINRLTDNQRLVITFP